MTRDSNNSSGCVNGWLNWVINLIKEHTIKNGLTEIIRLQYIGILNTLAYNK